MQRDDLPLDPVRLEVYRHLFTALAEAMGAALRRAAHSPNIKERRDYSCALFDGQGRVVAMGDHMPVHLGAMPLSVAAVLAELGPLAQGDIAVLNDPFRGGTHLPDITVVMPVYCRVGNVPVPVPVPVPDPVPVPVAGFRAPGRTARTPLAYLAARAHHADVGGMAPGSMPLARDIHQEGLRIPPLLLVRGGQRNEEVWKLILSNVRTPAEREGDLAAQLASLHAGEQRLLELVARRGVAEVRLAMASLLAYADRLVRAGIARIPAGVYRAEDVLDDDGCGSGPLPIRLQLTVGEGALIADFSGTAAQAAGGVNAVAAITTSCVRYAVRCVVEALLGQPLPAGGGAMEAVHLVLPAGSLVAAAPPAAVAGGNVETSQRITDVVFLALAQALPELIPAQSQGTMNNISVGGLDPRSGAPFAFYETVGGGMGAGP
ncbi:MAG: hydantoinase B/oxoprolinase family protein, partial [Gemmatimonadetes bacterium]|nr:hydantoinase B/oxoprolinase family protein [Gemmatimonadota bacterium]